MNEEGAPFDSGFDDAGPFSVTPEADGVALDAALREFGPAAFEDLLPRLRALAADLDAAHTTGFIHGRLHPSKVLVTDDGTYLLGARIPMVLDPDASIGAGRWPIQPPYTAPEVVGGAMPGPTADQYSLAAIAYEWMFGMPVAGPAERPVEVRSIPNVDRAELARAFTRALTPEPFRRFPSCADFCDALAAASAPSLPLVPAGDEVDRHLEPFVPEDKPAPLAPVVVTTEPEPELSFASESSNAATPEPDLDSCRPADGPVPSAFAGVVTAPRSESPRFGAVALLLATLVGAVFGFAAGYMARPRALQYAESQIPSSNQANEAQDSAVPGTPDANSQAPSTQGTPGTAGTSGTQGTKGTPEPSAPKNAGRLLIRSVPSGASVEVDGVARGVTPLALRDLPLGSRQVTVTRRGYVTDERRIALTEARPSRSVEVRLSQQAAAPPRPSTPASLGRPAATTGSLAVESRPAGASVTVNGKPIGVTPLVLSDLAPGEYQVTMTLEGYRPIATTVRVVAGERARAAARLTEQEQE